MSSQQVVFQYLSAGSHALTVPSGFSNQVLVYAWGAGGGDGNGSSGDTYQRTVSTRSGLYTGYSGSGGTYSYYTSTETITVESGVIPPPGTSSGLTTFGAWTKISSGTSGGVSGGGGGFVQGIVTVSSGDTIVISVGGHGISGPRNGSGIGGIGDNPVISFNGGSSGVSAPWGGDDNYIGAGGGGGGASAVFVNNIPMLVAAGGGGGGGGSNYQTGTVGLAGGVATSVNSTTRGANSGDNYATGGAGGAGYPYGGAAGASVGDDAGRPGGGYGGQNYANVNVTSSTLTAGSGVTPGGVTNVLYPKAKRGYAGYDGAVIVIFSKSFRAWIKDTTWKEANNAWVKANGVWKQITRAWIKSDGVWKPIQSGVNLVPIKVDSAPTSPVTINLTIAANTNNYVLSDYLSSTSYYPGHSIVNLTVNAGVIVGSGSIGTAALIIDGLVSGDLINLTNNGNIAGAGGLGGAAGSYTSVTSGGGKAGYGYFYGASYAGKGYYSVGTTTVTSVPGRPGQFGGPALYVTYQTNLVNNGTIAGGGGGGGGGGGPTGGQGGGGAGRKAGSGANNGTLTAAGAGAGLGGAGGARGTAGSAGTNDSSAGGAGGDPGAAIIGIDKVTISTEGTILGTRIV